MRRQGAKDDLLDFGDPATEVKNAQRADVIMPLNDLGVIRVSGEDAVSFLQNLLTNDVKALTSGVASLGGLCNVKGRLAATFLLWREDDDVLLALSGELVPTVLTRLSKYILRSKVKLADIGTEKVLIGIAGESAQATLEALGALATVPTQPMTTGRIRDSDVIRLDQQRFILALEADRAPALWRELAVSLRPAGLAAWHWLEIAAGIPRVTTATVEQFLPQMLNLELVGGVSFNKGCYPGQEIVARTQYLGKVKRRMYRVHVEAAVPVPGADVFASESVTQPCGTVILAAPSPLGGYEALVVIQSTGFETGDVHLGSPDEARLGFLPLPYTVT